MASLPDHESVVKAIVMISKVTSHVSSQFHNILNDLIIIVLIASKQEIFITFNKVKGLLINRNVTRFAKILQLHTFNF